MTRTIEEVNYLVSLLVLSDAREPRQGLRNYYRLRVLSNIEPDYWKNDAKRPDECDHHHLNINVSTTLNSFDTISADEAPYFGPVLQPIHMRDSPHHLRVCYQE